jgi:hypothetical protein
MLGSMSGSATSEPQYSGQPFDVEMLYLEAEHFTLIAEAQPPLEPRERVVPCGSPRRSFPLREDLASNEEKTT